MYKTFIILAIIFSNSIFAADFVDNEFGPPKQIVFTDGSYVAVGHNYRSSMEVLVSKGYECFDERHSYDQIIVCEYVTGRALLLVIEGELLSDFL